MKRVLVTIGIALAMAALLPFMRAQPEMMPSLATVRAAWTPSDAIVLDRNGRLLDEVRVDAQQRRLSWTALEDVSPALRAAIVASEDRRFFSHHGVDAIAALGVGLRRLAGEPLRGASTITMQLATQLDPTLRRAGDRRGVWRKWRQMRSAWLIEQRWSKREILEAYLNLISFRGELQGVAAATRVLFGKNPDGVSEAEALVLAALIRAPNANAETVASRAQRLRVAATMTVPDDDIRVAAAPLTETNEFTSPDYGTRQLARRVLTDVPSARTVTSTVDVETQRVAAHSLRDHLLALREKDVQDGAVLVVENASGDVVAYVGGSGALSRGRCVDAIRAHRQAGSTLKPFLYGLAFDLRLLTPASLLDDGPLDLAVAGGVYRPENYDQQFHGIVTARTALAGSLNVPAVRTLGTVGADTFVDRLRRLGFAALNEPGDYYGPALALGAADVSLEELVNAYRALANGGTLTPLRFRRDALPSTNSPLTLSPSKGVRVYSDAATFLITDILADRESRSVTFGLESPLATRFWSAVKTGTSKSMRDNWCIGYSHRYTVGVWIGNLSGEPMRGVSGMSGAAPIWLDVMEWLHGTDSIDSRLPAAPNGVVAAKSAEREWFIAGTEPTSAVSLVRGRTRISAPVSGAIIAIDPDIPSSRQRVALRAEGAEAWDRWQLDGIDVGSAGQPQLWAPRAGVHTLAVVAPTGVTRDAVRFSVRGNARDRG